MYKIFFLLLAPLLLFAAPLKIVSLKQQTNTIEIRFDKNVKQSDFKKYTIKSGIYYDINAELTLKKRTFKLNNNFITIAQNNKNISRIVIESKNPKTLTFRINKNILYLGFSSMSKANAKTTTKATPKNTESSEIVSLFSSIDSQDKPTKKPPTNPKPTTKNTESKDSNIDKSIESRDSKVIPKATKSKTIVLDPGHGGKDCGAQVGKICEKSITLNISKKTQELLKSRGYTVYVTRSGDKYISLTDRTKFANDKGADVFISIHANALDKNSKNYKTTSGIETYFLSTARSERAKKVAELENKDDIEVMNYFSKLSFLNSINSQRLLASNKLAIDIQAKMLVNVRNVHSNTIDGGVREGPFWVLAGALMPSVLVEVGYMTNSDDLARLQTKEYQNIIAKGIADGIESYFLKNS